MALAAAIGLTALNSTAAAADSIWQLNPGDNDYNNGANWDSGVPGSGDTAFFGTSNTTSLTFSANMTVGGWTFNAGADDFVFTTNNPTLRFFGAGIVVNGGSAVTITNDGFINFNNNSTAGGADITNNRVLDFFDGSTAGGADITNNELLSFYHNSTAGGATIINNDRINFRDGSTAGSAIITNNGDLNFINTSTAGSATIVNNDDLIFFDTSTGGQAQILTNAGGETDFSPSTGPLNNNQLTAGSFAGAGNYALGDNELTVGGNNLSSEVSGLISGGGLATGTSLIKTGTGTFTLSGANTYTGATIVNQGTLIVDNSIMSDTAVNNGATLGGSGVVVGDVTVNNGGMLTPGSAASPAGTLAVHGVGGVTFETGSTYVVMLDDDGDVPGTNNNLLNAPNAITINGGTVHVTPMNGTDTGSTYTPGLTYLIITSTNTTGEFDSDTPSDDFALLDFELGYVNDAVYLTSMLAGGGGGTCPLGLSANQAGTCESALGIGSGAFYTALLNLSNAELPTALDLSSGEIHASGQHVIDQTFALFTRTLRQQGVAGIGSGLSNGPAYTAPLAYGPANSTEPGVAAIDDATASAYANERVANAWLAPLGGGGSVDADGNAGALDWWTAGLAGGYEGPVDVASGNAWLGFGLGYLRSHGAVDARLSTMDADNFNIGLYGGWADGPWTLAGSLAYAASKVSTERHIVFTGFDQTARADYWNHTVGFSGEAAYGFNVAPGTTLSPLATLDAGWSGHGGFTETGAGGANLAVGSESWTRLDTGLGLALAHTMPTETGAVTFEARALWEHAFADVVPTQSLAFAGSPTGFTVLGPDAGRDRLRLGAGVAFQMSDDLTVRANYDGLFSGDQQNHTANLTLNIGF